MIDWCWMSLSEHERRLIARRASGEYAIVSRVEKIVREHKKNRDPADANLLEFARLVTKKTWSWDEYSRLQKIVLEEAPEPWGPRLRPKQPKQSKQPKRSKRVVRCGICGGEGHNARTCAERPDTPTVQYTDGIERLSPGFDPNPPERVEEDQGDAA